MTALAHLKGKGATFQSKPSYDQLETEVSSLGLRLENAYQEAYNESCTYFQSQDRARREDFEKLAADIKIEAVTNMGQAENATKLYYGRELASAESSIRTQNAQMQSEHNAVLGQVGALRSELTQSQALIAMGSNKYDAVANEVREWQVEALQF